MEEKTLIVGKFRRRVIPNAVFFIAGIVPFVFVPHLISMAIGGLGLEGIKAAILIIGGIVLFVIAFRRVMTPDCTMVITDKMMKGTVGKKRGEIPIRNLSLVLKHNRNTLEIRLRDNRIVYFYGCKNIDEIKSVLDKLIKEYERGEQERQELVEHNEICKNLFLKCRKNGITTVNESNREDLFLVARNLNISEDDALDMFEEGKNLVQEREYSDSKTAEKEAFDKQFEKTKVIGKAKYIGNLPEMLRAAEGFTAANDSAINYGSLKTQTQARHHDWAVIGGMAEGIAGTAVGVAAAMSTQAANARADAFAEQMRHQGYEIMEIASKASSMSSSFASDVRYVLEGINDLILDDAFDDFDSTVRLSVDNKIVTGVGNMIVTLKTELMKKPSILGKPAAIDGSVIVEAYKGGKLVGKGYYSAPGMNDCNIKQVGFRNGVQRISSDNYKRMISQLNNGKAVILCGVDGNRFAAGEKYTFRFVPMAIWAIQEAYFDTITEADYRKYQNEMRNSMVDIITR